MSAPRTPPPTVSELRALADAVEGQDHFARLGVARDATAPTVQAAYLSLAKRWHPDRLPASLATESVACARLFAALTEAQRTLTDAADRATYVAALDGGREDAGAGAAAAELLGASVAVQRAYASHARGDVAGAERWCRQACASDPSLADARALLAWLEATRPAATDGHRSAGIAELGRLLDAAPGCVRALQFRALLWKCVGDGDRARRDLQRILSIDPRNVDALRELRRPDSKKGARPQTASGIFARLFGRKTSGT